MKEVFSRNGGTSNKLHSWYDKDNIYIDVVNDMYDDSILGDDDIEELDLSKKKMILRDNTFFLYN